jgi:hypothetical protein
MKYELKRVGIWSTIKIGFLVWGLLGFLSGIYMALMMPVFLSMLGSMGGSPFDLDVNALTPVALIFLPFFYSIMGAVAGSILTVTVAGFYNLVSRLLGGIEVDLEGDMIHPLEVPVRNYPGGSGEDVHSV